MIKTVGTPPGMGAQAPQLRYVRQDKSDAELAELKGKVVILCSYPSIDTSTCARETRTFNEKGAGLGAIVLIVSMDLPFAMKRFCEAEGITNVETGSDFRFRDMSDRWGVAIAEGNMRGTHARCVWVIDREGVIRHFEQTEVLGEEPDYERVLAVAKVLIGA